MAIHVYPIEDWIEHIMSLDCPCQPEIQFKDPDTDEEYAEALIIHNQVSEC